MNQRTKTQQWKYSDSPYWDWVYNHRAGREPVEANPESLCMAEAEEPSDKLKAVLEVINEGGLQVLTPQERKVFQLVAVEGRSLKRVANMLGLSKASVTTYLKRAGKKLRGLCQPKL